MFIFDLKGNRLQEIGGPGANDGQFTAPNAVTIDKNNQIYVTDSGNNRVQVFDEKGKFLRIINGSKDGKGQSIFLNPRGVGVDSRGEVYIVNNGAHNISAFDNTGKQLTTFGGMGTDNNSFYLPNGLFIDQRGTMYITDTVNRRVCVYN